MSSSSLCISPCTGPGVGISPTGGESRYPKGDTVLVIYLPPWGCAEMLPLSSSPARSQASLNHTKSWLLSLTYHLLLSTEQGAGPWHSPAPRRCPISAGCCWCHKPQSSHLMEFCQATRAVSGQEQRILSWDLIGKQVTRPGSIPG